MCCILLCISFADGFLLLCLHLSTLVEHFISLFLPCFLWKVCFNCPLLLSDGIVVLSPTLFSPPSCIAVRSCTLVLVPLQAILNNLEQQIGALAGKVWALCRGEHIKEMSSVHSSFLLTQIIEAMLIGRHNHTDEF